MSEQTSQPTEDDRSPGTEPAYPSFQVRRIAEVEKIDVANPGLTKRELFAAMAMQGLAPQYAQGANFMEKHVAEGAVKMADALLKELAK